jgi:hypothetical protein
MFTYYMEAIKLPFIKSVIKIKKFKYLIIKYITPKMTERISITRALAELKLLDNRIEKQIDTNDFVHFISKKKSHNITQLTQNAKSSYQSITDLISRRNALKSAIILSNSRTTVRLGNKTLTVAEVIEGRQVVPLYKQLLQKLKMNRENVTYQVERATIQMETDLQKILEINFGKNNNLKTNSDDIDTISKTYRENNKSEMLDCIGIDTRIKELETTIEQYETESNFLLSESNATTFIEV